MARKVALGDHLYIFRSGTGLPNPAEDHLLISAHGGWSTSDGTFKVPQWTQLYFYGREGASIKDPGVYNVMKGEWQVVEAAGAGTLVRDYQLSKYQGRHGNEKETYDSIGSSIDRNSEAMQRMAQGDKYVKDRNFGYNFDVLTVRNRNPYNPFATTGSSLKKVLQTLSDNGYKYENIHCSFCRWEKGGGSVSATKFGT